MVELASIRCRNGEKRWKIDNYSAESGLIMANGWKDICHTHFARKRATKVIISMQRIVWVSSVVVL